MADHSFCYAHSPEVSKRSAANGALILSFNYSLIKPLSLPSNHLVREAQVKAFVLAPPFVGKPFTIEDL